jgi:hypothetical protein
MKQYQCPKITYITTYQQALREKGKDNNSLVDTDKEEWKLKVKINFSLEVE